ncbi:uncharacterized protein LOC133173325 [Saccostrea echinata]|uniref:uncharacterized protein LOC133173325 n=1 Tax=Saccostrea echinata TaxID=191078 RepID=UPI002A81F078|nr:uncharacterized protein LOC133173325 [Saccostrea echinata]
MDQTIQCLVMVVMVITAQGMGTLPTPHFYVDRENGETGRYYVTLPSTGNKYLCYYDKASSLHIKNAFSEPCYEQNKEILTDTENTTKTYPYFFSKVGEPPGCGSLPNVTGAKDEWACPRGVSPLSVPVYESCHLQCFDGASIKVRCTEKLKFDGLTSHMCRIETRTDKTIKTSSIFFSTASTVPSSAENLPGETLPNSLIAIIVSSGIGFFVIIFLMFFFLRRCLSTNYKLFRKRLFQTAAIDIDHVSNFADTNSADGSTNQGADCLINKNTRPVLYGSDEVGQVEIDKLTPEDLDLDNSDTANDRSCIVFYQRTNSSSNQHDSVEEESEEYLTANKETCASDSFNYHQDGREESKTLSPISPFAISNKHFYPLDVSSLRGEDPDDVREDVAFIEWHPQKADYAEPAFLPIEYSGKSSPVSCTTISAMLEGAMDNSVHFVDDLSTLLDPDVQYKNPRNWQGLAQAFLGLSYNKIMEIRHKTKDHFKEGILPLLSSHGYTVYDVTNYFSLLPSRRVDVIECIQRYHPNCQKCGEIYNSLKSDLLNVS